MVDFIEGCIDEGAPELNVTGVAAVERISPNQMRVTYFRRRKGEIIATVHLVWDRAEWLKQWSVWEARASLTNDGFELPAKSEDELKAMH